MNDIVSIRKMRPLPSSGPGRFVGTDGGDVSVETGGDDFFFGGNKPSLPATEFFTASRTGETSLAVLIEKISDQRVSPCLPPCLALVKRSWGSRAKSANPPLHKQRN